MSEKEISTSETTRAFGAFKGLFFGMRALMTLEVLQASERPATGRTSMRAGLVSLGGRHIIFGVRLAVGLLLRVLFGGSWSC